MSAAGYGDPALQCRSEISVHMIPHPHMIAPAARRRSMRGRCSRERTSRHRAALVAAGVPELEAGIRPWRRGGRRSPGDHPGGWTDRVLECCRLSTVSGAQACAPGGHISFRSDLHMKIWARTVVGSCEPCASDIDRPLLSIRVGRRQDYSPADPGS